ncbi:MAG TPA: hypothetical protein VGQ49_16565 [Bryobacteraceae bacterium]|nr:hypothetical protein [Bryobacteraceae bacterium]
MGLFFVGATRDARLRAFDSRTGKELWATKLPYTSTAVPITFQARTANNTWRLSRRAERPKMVLLETASRWSCFFALAPTGPPGDIKYPGTHAVHRATKRP